jgi:hypothetical protein
LAAGIAHGGRGVEVQKGTRKMMTLSQLPYCFYRHTPRLTCITVRTCIAVNEF